MPFPKRLQAANAPSGGDYPNLRDVSHDFNTGDRLPRLPRQRALAYERAPTRALSDLHEVIARAGSGELRLSSSAKRRTPSFGDVLDLEVGILAKNLFTCPSGCNEANGAVTRMPRMHGFPPMMRGVTSDPRQLRQCASGSSGGQSSCQRTPALGQAAIGPSLPVSRRKTGLTGEAQQTFPAYLFDAFWKLDTA